MKLHQFLYFSIFLIASFLSNAQFNCNALHFDGEDDFVEIPSLFEGSSAITVEMWFKSENTNNSTDCLEERPGDLSEFRWLFTTEDDGFGIGECGGELRFAFRPLCSARGAQLCYSLPTFNVRDGQWHHVAYTKGDGTEVPYNGIRLYIDGEYFINFDQADFDFSGLFRLGRGNNGKNWAGMVDELRIWNTARTAEEIAANYRCQVAADATGLLSYYRMDEGQANGNNSGISTLRDFSIQNNTATLQNFVLQSDQSNFVAGIAEVCRTCTSSARITGRIFRPDETAVKHVTISVTGAVEGVPTFVTDESGNYDLELNQTGENFTINATKEEFEPEGITSADALILAQYLRGEIELDAYQIIAADLNRDARVTTADLAILRRFLENGVPIPNPWQFIDANYTFSNPANPLVDNFPEVINVFGAPMPLYNFIAIKKGDLFDTPTVASSDLLFDLTDIEECLEIGDTINIDVQVSNFKDIRGIQFSLDWDSNLFDFSAFSNLNPALSGQLVNYVANGDYIAFLWSDPSAALTLPDGARLFSFSLVAQSSGNYQTQGCLSDNLMFEIIDSDYNAYNEFATPPDCANIISNCDTPPTNAFPCDSVELVIDTFYCNTDNTVYYEFSLLNNSSLTFDAVDFYDPILGQLVGFNQNTSFGPGETFGPLSRDFTPNEDGIICLKAFLFNYEEELCCHTEICAEVPMCINCDSLAVEAVPIEEENCCYNLNLINNDGNNFTQVVATITTPDVSFRDVQAANSWQVIDGSNSLNIQFQSGNIPTGNNNALQFCLEGIQRSNQMPQEIIFEWYADFEGEEVVVCRDTILLECQCAIVENENLLCNTDGTIQFNFDLINQTDRNVGYLRFDVIEPAGIEFDNCLPKLTSVNNALTFPVSLTLNDCGTALTAGTEVKYRISMLDTETDEWCCHLDTLSIVLPNCDEIVETACECNDAFEQAVQEGFDLEVECEGRTAVIEAQHRASLAACDSIFWLVNDRVLVRSRPNETVNYSVQSTGSQSSSNSCMRVLRVMENGKTCEFEYCRSIENCTIIVDPEEEEEEVFRISPNPVREELYLSSKADILSYQIFDAQGQMLQANTFNDNDKIDTHQLQSGLYFLQIQMADRQLYVQRFIKD